MAELAADTHACTTFLLFSTAGGEQAREQEKKASFEQQARLLLLVRFHFEIISYLNEMLGR